jgi:hypothetical protein
VATRLFHAIVIIGTSAAASLAVGCGAAPGGAPPDDAALHDPIADDAGASDAMGVDGEADADTADAMRMDGGAASDAEPDVDLGWAPTK